MTPVRPAWDDRPWARWAVSLVEPLVPSRLVEDYLAKMRDQARHHPQVARTIMVGTLVDVASSLPDDDPWRSEESFSGTWHDGVDLVGEVEVPAEDISLGALAIPLSKPAYALVRAAFAGEAELIRVWDMGPDVREGTEALAWLTWRRRAIAGLDDFYVVVSFHAWLNRVRGGVVLYDEKHLISQRAKNKLDEF